VTKNVKKIDNSTEKMFKKKLLTTELNSAQNSVMKMCLQIWYIMSPSYRTPIGTLLNCSIHWRRPNIKLPCAPKAPEDKPP